MHRTLLHRRLPLPAVIAWRYMLGQRSRMLSSTALAALVATTLGVTAMVIAMALMTGYTEDLQRKLIGLQGEVVAYPLDRDGFENSREALGRTAEIPGVVRIGRVSYGEGSLSSPAVSEGQSVVLRGVECQEVRFNQDSWDVCALGNLGCSEVDEEGIPGALLGEELARRLAVEEGDVLRLVVLRLGGPRTRFHYRSIRMCDSFSTGFAEFDARWILLDRDVLVAAQGGETGYDVLEFKLADPAATEGIAASIEELLGAEWRVERWQHLNRDLFAALQLQETLLFLVLGLIVIVSTFNVASTLMILVRERMRDIGLLGALGLTPRRLWWSFATYGMLLGALGTLLGALLGSSVAWVITEFELVRFGPEVAAIYFIDSVPFRVEVTDLAAIVTFALAVTLVACSLPASRAARVRPATALRDE
ncbi:MAG: ABC transporter permease [bacterium]|nr:ABC transporter permease [bacterium]